MRGAASFSPPHKSKLRHSGDPSHKRFVESAALRDRSTSRSFKSILGIIETDFQRVSGSTRLSPFRECSQSRRRNVLFRVSSRSRSPVYIPFVDLARVLGSGKDRRSRIFAAKAIVQCMSMRRTGVCMVAWLASSVLAAAQAAKPASPAGVTPGKFSDITIAAGIHFQHVAPHTTRKYLLETMAPGVALVRLRQRWTPRYLRY